MFDSPLARASSLSQRDPRFRIASAFLFALVTATLQEKSAALLALLAASLLLFLSRPFVKEVFKRLFPVNLFVFCLALILPFSLQGLSLNPSEEGIQMALLMVIKANAIAISFIALVATMELPVVGYAMERLAIPSKLVFLFLFTLRFIHIIGAEWKRLMTAAKLRGFVLRCNRLGYRTIGTLFGTLLFHSYERAQRVHEAMLLRGFSGHFHSVTRFQAQWQDFVFLFSIFLLLSVILILEFC